MKKDLGGEIGERRPKRTGVWGVGVGVGEKASSEPVMDQASIQWFSLALFA